MAREVANQLGVARSPGWQGAVGIGRWVVAAKQVVVAAEQVVVAAEQVAAEQIVVVAEQVVVAAEQVMVLAPPEFLQTRHLAQEITPN